MLAAPVLAHADNARAKRSDGILRILVRSLARPARSGQESWSCLSGALSFSPLPGFLVALR